jgi:hypothetical protein
VSNDIKVPEFPTPDGRRLEDEDEDEHAADADAFASIVEMAGRQ